MRWKYIFDDEARKAATVCTVDPERQAAFLAGVGWLAERVKSMVREDLMENLMDKGTKEYCARLALKDLREILHEALKQVRAEDEPCPPLLTAGSEASP